MNSFEKLVNFRDLGGIKTTDGKVIQEKRILRSGELVGLTEKDKTTLLDVYHLKNIIDFRGDDELAKRPDDILEGTNYYHIDIMKKEKKKSNQETFEKEMHSMHPDELMNYIYREIIVDQNASAGYRQFIDILLNQEEGSSIFHCFAGKDRTGIGAAIILTLLGVSKEDIFKDYLETIEARKAHNEQLVAQKRAAGATEEQLEHLRIMMSVKADYLEVAYETATKEYGSFEAYIQKAIGVTSEEQEQLKALYLK